MDSASILQIRFISERRHTLNKDDGVTQRLMKMMDILIKRLESEAPRPVPESESQVTEKTL